MVESQNKKILIIDDDPFILDMYVLKFKEEKLPIETAQDGKAGLEKIRNINPALVLLDIVMPIMDGFEVLQELKKEDLLKNRKVVLLTNLGQKNDIDRGMQLGASDYIIKAHFTPTEVVEKAKKILAE